MYPKYLPASTFSDLSDYWSRARRRTWTLARPWIS